MKWLSYYRTDDTNPGHGSDRDVLLKQIQRGETPFGEETPALKLSDSEVLAVADQWPEFESSWCRILHQGQMEEIARRVADGEYDRNHVKPLDSLILAPPVPDPSKVIALGRNYESHAAEQNCQVTPKPLLFAKAPSSLIGHDGVVVVPANESKPDFEAEMVLVIGKRGKNVRAEEAADYIAGITAFNDVSGREAQFSDKLWFRGKGPDTFGPLGPWVVTLDEIDDINDLAISMTVNGEVMQSASTRELVFDAAAIIAFISEQMTLLPGDLVATGTPAGVGVFRDPPIALQDGDEMEVYLEGVGVLHNRVVRL